MKIVVITGCCGFIGGHFCRNALNKGWKVHGIDKMTEVSNDRLQNEFLNHPNFKFHKKDIKDLTYLPDCDIVINFAAASHVQNSITDSNDFINSNVLGVENLLNLIKNKHANVNDTPRICHISTDEVYGDTEIGKFLETDILCPSNPYAASKAAADMLVLAWGRTHKIKYNIVRMTNNYGTYQAFEKLIPLSVKNLMRNKKIRLHNNGTPIRNWLHVEDTCSAIFTIIEKGKINEIYNVSGNFEQKNKETVRKIIKAYCGTDKNWEQYVDFGHIRVGQDVRYSIDDEKLKVLGWFPQKDFDKEIKNIVDFYKRNMIW